VKIEADLSTISVQITRPDLVGWAEWDAVTTQVERFHLFKARTAA
jgi:hypothetical protein